ncbi:MAG: hypothetical protein ACKPI7_14220 [Microcystis panniformis]
MKIRSIPPFLNFSLKPIGKKHGHRENSTGLWGIPSPRGEIPELAGIRTRRLIAFASPNMFPDNMLPEETNGDRLSGHLKHILVNTERLSLRGNIHLNEVLRL